MISSTIADHSAVLFNFIIQLKLVFRPIVSTGNQKAHEIMCGSFKSHKAIAMSDYSRRSLIGSLLATVQTVGLTSK